MARRQKNHARTRDARRRPAKVIAAVTQSPPRASAPEGDTPSSRHDHPPAMPIVIPPANAVDDLDDNASGRASLAQFDATFFSREPEYGTRDLDSWPPTAEDAGDAPLVVAPPYVLARRFVYRRVVGVVLAAAILVLITGLGRQVASRTPLQGSVAAVVPGAP